jgi:hypothetical protein
VAPRVPFQQALSLVGSRGAYLEGGYAFVPLARLVSTVVTRVRLFTVSTQEALALTTMTSRHCLFHAFC